MSPETNEIHVDAEYMQDSASKKRKFTREAKQNRGKRRWGLCLKLECFFLPGATPEWWGQRGGVGVGRGGGWGGGC